ncbi:hypothetical protein ACWCOW_13155 [Streptomyces sp. NPDC001939]
MPPHRSAQLGHSLRDGEQLHGQFLRAHYCSREAHRRDIDRFNQVLRCPEVRLLLRFTAADVFQRPERMIEEICAALA